MAENITAVNDYLNKLTDFGFDYGPKLIGGLLVLIIGLWATKFITNGIGRSLAKTHIDQSLIPFLKSLTNIMLKILVVITVMGMIGIQMTSFIALLGAAGLAIGMALSGTLQNFAGGVIILIFKPFKLGDFIEAQGFLGTVKEIGIFTTMLNTIDKKLIIIPNGPLSNGSLTNYSTEPQRRVDWTFGIAYGDRVEDFRRAMGELIADDARILPEPESFIGLSELGDSSVNFTVRAWVKSEDYWNVFFDMNEKFYKKAGDYNINIPFPQMDVHLHNKQ
ncbi:MAG TPA: mechanosensitive ion channel protein MscS [Bacteroidales bacterium]|nr:MAG: mechanosensitive ion channel protein MscS [Bacteroidetes bacterium GWE2_42_24]OFY31848.1 MAG: mechanosensitive ion channel protein MscS [Bacteroidetes bacterium GWF2_43_11]HAQ65417.1 mechanosensitive ion channel protein MscS [Bacteroidales bacterium]HBZ66486.1 mechanosensitive ion channel protein MscS [Bacteroidales bacterium]